MFKVQEMEDVQGKMGETYYKIQKHLEREKKGTIKRTIAIIAYSLGFKTKTVSSYFHMFLDTGIIRKSYSNNWVWVGMESLKIVGDSKDTVTWIKSKTSPEYKIKASAQAPERYTQHPTHP
jgi:hypothetical protein